MEAKKKTAKEKKLVFCVEKIKKIKMWNLLVLKKTRKKKGKDLLFSRYLIFEATLKGFFSVTEFIWLITN